jgi:DNA-directed RNA polymerase subunit RPC12/RpoP
MRTKCEYCGGTRIVDEKTTKCEGCGAPLEAVKEERPALKGLGGYAPRQMDWDEWRMQQASRMQNMSMYGLHGQVMASAARGGGK